MRSLTNPNWGTICFLGSSAGKEHSCNAGDLSWIPGLGRSPGEGKGYPLQYSGLENFMDCLQSWTQLNGFHFLSAKCLTSTYQNVKVFFFLFTLLYVFIHSFIYFWPCWDCIAACGLSVAAESSRLFSSWASHCRAEDLCAPASVVAAQGLISCCGSRVLERAGIGSCGMWAQ